MRRFRKEHSPEKFSARIYTALMELKEGIHIVHCCDFLVVYLRGADGTKLTVP